MAAGEEKLREPFLKNEKRYYENCPGCKVDQLKETKSGLPITELFSIWIIVLCTGKFWPFALKGCFLFSFFPRFILQIYQVLMIFLVKQGIGDFYFLHYMFLGV